MACHTAGAEAGPVPGCLGDSGALARLGTDLPPGVTSFTTLPLPPQQSCHAGTSKSSLEAPPLGSPMSWPSPCCHQSLHVVTPAASPSRHHCLPTRAHAGLHRVHGTGVGIALQPGGLSLTFVSTNLRVNRARLVSKAHQGHQAPLDQVDLSGIRDCQGP